MHFILYNPKCSLVGTKKPHKLEDPKLYWLIISYQQDVSASFPTPRSGTIISRCFSNVFRIKSCSCFLTKVGSPPRNCWCYQQLSLAFSSPSVTLSLLWPVNSDFQASPKTLTALSLVLLFGPHTKQPLLIAPPLNVNLPEGRAPVCPFFFNVIYLTVCSMFF